MSTKIAKTWSQLKTVVEYSRKFIYAINNNVPSNVNFREYLNPETGLKEYRIYFLASTQKHDVTIKYVTVTLDSLHDDKLIGSNIFQATNAPKIENKKLTKKSSCTESENDVPSPILHNIQLIKIVALCLVSSLIYFHLMTKYL